MPEKKQAEFQHEAVLPNSKRKCRFNTESNTRVIQVKGELDPGEDAMPFDAILYAVRKFVWTPGIFCYAADEKGNRKSLSKELAEELRGVILDVLFPPKKGKKRVQPKRKRQSPGSPTG